MKNFKWALFFLVLIALCLTVMLCRNFSGGKTARILLDGEVIRTVNLKNVSEPYEFTVTNENGGYNTIRAEKGRIAVVDASCPDKICVHQGFIENASVPIVCLPNKLSVVILSDSENDAVSGGAFN